MPIQLLEKKMPFKMRMGSTRNFTYSAELWVNWYETRGREEGQSEEGQRKKGRGRRGEEGEEIGK